MPDVIFGPLALDLATTVMSGAAIRLGEAAFGPAQERALKGLLGESIRTMLEALTRSGELAEDDDYLAKLRTRLSNFYSDQEVAEALISFAIDSNEPLRVGRLRDIY